MSDIPEDLFRSSYYDSEYFAGQKGGKSFMNASGSLHKWSYFNPDGEWLGCKDIVKAWKEMFGPSNLLDVGCGRGQIVAYARDIEIEAEGFDYSEWATSDEGRYPRTKSEWIKCHDATERWPYPDNSFDLITALDFYEHIYSDDIDFVIDEMYRVAKKWIFLQIAVIGGGSGAGRHEVGYIFSKDEPIPIGLEGCAVAGHVTVQNKEFWSDKLLKENVFIRHDLLNWFCSLVDKEVIRNWLLNLILVLEVYD